MKQKLQLWAIGYGRSFSFIGLSLATLFFAASVTPSLLPRHPVTQGLLSGFALATGYAVGVVLVWFYRFLELKEPPQRIQKTSKWVTAVIVACIFVTFIWRMTYWQNSIRELMEMPPLETAYPYRVAFIAVVFGAVLVAITRVFLSACYFVSRRLERYFPRRISITIGFSLVLALTAFLGNDLVVRRLLDAVDSFFARIDIAVTDDIVRPDDELQCGSEASLIDWAMIGRQGKAFLSNGPKEPELADFLEREVLRPIRVYAGMRSRPTFQGRAELALEELKRVGGFDRSVLVVATPTGTGWLDPSAVDPLEYLHGGDCAIVSMQYSYLPSWITILIDPRRSIESGDALFDAVYGYWKTLPKTERPRLYLHGLSLGSFGSEGSADLYQIFEDPIQGSVWSGPPFPSSRWKKAVDNRNPESPVWLPTIDEGRLLRFTGKKNSIDPDQQWGPIRNVYLQHASDPMVWFSPDLAWTSPSWLRQPRGPDVSPYLRWYPIVTFLQVGFDIPMATSVPIGYGHNYAPEGYIHAWIAVTQPENWDSEKTKRLLAEFENRQAPKP